MASLTSQSSRASERSKACLLQRNETQHLSSKATLSDSWHGILLKDYWHGILFEEPNPTGSRPRDLIGLYKQQKKPHPPNTVNTQGRARREHGGEQGHPGEAESHTEDREKMEGPKIAEALRRQRGGDQRSLRPERTSSMPLLISLQTFLSPAAFLARPFPHMVQA